ncbi:MAG: exodeoxyribonuclease VII large subunit [Planctomycetes bacterium]|nr:exodeoxyribonuclease VII large subunit [Planctomycetota bacterium]
MSRFEGEVVSVSELIERAREALDCAVGVVAVEGEVFEYRGPHSSGHYYFKLRDSDTSIDVKMWRGAAQRGLRCALEEGRAVLGIGRLDIWPKRGVLSFLLDEVHDLGAGDLARRFEELKQRLLREGLFDESRKQGIPERPCRVGLITARDSAAAADVEQTWLDLGAPFEVVYIPSRVQGDGAEHGLVKALLAAARQDVDVVLLTRGGGSLEDLWAFNEEVLVRAIAACPVPVICVVGHETDFTLADFVADLRCKTPTAGAARLVEGWLRTQRRLLRLGARLADAGPVHWGLARARWVIAGEALPESWSNRCRQLRERYQASRMTLQAQRPDRRLARAQQRLAENELRFFHASEAGRMQWALRAQRWGRRLLSAGPNQELASFARIFSGQGARLEAGSPTALLERGYALVERSDMPGFLRQANEVKLGDVLRIRLAAGQLEATVDAITDEPEKVRVDKVDLRE